MVDVCLWLLADPKITKIEVGSWPKAEILFRRDQVLLIEPEVFEPSDPHRQSSGCIRDQREVKSA